MNRRKPIRQADRTLVRPYTRRHALATALLAASMATTIVSSARGDTHAHASRSLNVTDTAHLHYVKEAHAQLIDEGPATGTVPGSVRVSFDVGATVTASFTIYAHGGTLSGHGSGTLHNSTSKSDVYISFGGKMTVTHGTGLYVHAHGTGGFYGVVDRRNYSSTIQTTGTLSY